MILDTTYKKIKLYLKTLHNLFLRLKSLIFAQENWII